VSVGIIFKSIMLVLRVRLFRGQFFEPYFKIMMQAGFIIIDKDTAGDVHGVAKQETLLDSAFFEALLHPRGNIDQLPAAANVEP